MSLSDALQVLVESTSTFLVMTSSPHNYYIAILWSFGFFYIRWRQQQGTTQHQAAEAKVEPPLNPMTVSPYPAERLSRGIIETPKGTPITNGLAPYPHDPPSSRVSPKEHNRDNPPPYRPPSYSHSQSSPQATSTSKSLSFVPRKLKLRE
ncbi:hypothetical protein CVT24_006019 [Panaeolus cyanescens]|uniref:Uncharacterized protein n=1 Tax=Panaeolus cyanescens TaxID=181874 RepID=A0A409YE43_9AGAR|nr:hypothetical protein CVT24_006019 [Panaeolus cyanescens]